MSEGTAPFAFARSLTVCVDFNSPHAYLAVAPTRELEARLRLKADWLPLSLPPPSPPKPARSGDDRGTRHRRIRSEYFAADLERYAGARGLTLGNIYRSLDCTWAFLGLLWMRQHATDRVGDYVEAIFERIWADEGDVDAGSIDRLLVDLQVGNDAFVRWADASGTALLSEVQAGLQAAGLFNVPAYVVGNDVFYGRQHLPMIEWLLTGRAGEPPI